MQAFGEFFRLKLVIFAFLLVCAILLLTNLQRKWEYLIVPLIKKR